MMIMKKYSIFATCFALTISVTAMAATSQRTVSEMQSVASATLAERYSLPAKAPQAFRVATETSTYSVLTCGSGTVIVNKDSEQEAVLGYSDSSFDLDNMPCGLKWWFEAMDAALQRPNNGKTASNVPAQLPASVSPLVSCQWGQGSPYNSQCPNGAQVGCVAVAMGQVMYANSFPYRGSGSHSYSNGGQQLTVDFGNTTYNWSQMDEDEVAKLLYHCGVAVNMDYTSGSYTHTSNAATALSQYFRYKTDARYISRSAYSTSEWTEILFGNLAAGHPVIYRGTQESATSSSGHAFVIDGYDASGNVHVNWGWKGNMDGYYDLSTLQLMFGDSYQYNQAMVCDIVPSETIKLSLDLGGGGLINLLVDNGNSYEFGIIPDEGYAIDYVEYNSSDVTSQLDANNTFITPSITANATLKVVTKPDGPGQINGDANEDGKVDVNDVTTTINYILGKNPSPFNYRNANVNDDNTVNVMDVTTLINIILGNQ